MFHQHKAGSPRPGPAAKGFSLVGRGPALIPIASIKHHDLFKHRGFPLPCSHETLVNFGAGMVQPSLDVTHHFGLNVPDRIQGIGHFSGA
jgi:hypothetical protein